MKIIDPEVFLDTYLGAGLFGHLGIPVKGSKRVVDESYTKLLAFSSAFCLLVLIGGVIFLFMDHHRRASLVLLAFGVIWVYAGYDRARLTK
ncbi:hypothetical protein [Tunturiibacter gelidoferens]|uniref:Uncharacterized protein n=1 Tax=Tunturiibacter gelidiferens TaxID=3069689 RepID=A0A9X0U4K1_9BACT|nr:hypothetical protein [Edaphobacter lichenicola]MBB5329408.1 hypothetical protein [Edaphobacter lichenicola]